MIISNLSIGCALLLKLPIVALFRYPYANATKTLLGFLQTIIASENAASMLPLPLPLALVNSLSAVFDAGEAVLCLDQEDFLLGDLVQTFFESSPFFSAVLGPDQNITELLNYEQVFRGKTLFVGCQRGQYLTPQMFSKNFIWLEKEGAVNLGHLPLRLDSNLLAYDTKEGLYEIREKYKVKGGTLLRTKLGHWSEEQGLNLIEEELWERRSDLGGAVLTNVMLPWTLWNIVTSEGATLEGMMPDVMASVAESLHFTPQWKRPSDGSFGSQKACGQWTGIVGDLVKGLGDVSTGGLALTSKRQRAIDFSIGFFEDEFRLYQLSSLGSRISVLNFSVFLKNFSTLVWMAMFLAIFVVVGLSALSNRTLRMKGTGDEAFGPHLLGIWFPISGVATTACIEKHSSRIMFFSAAFLTYMLFTVYCADLMAYMTVGKATSIHGCSDIAKDHLSIYTGGGSAAVEMLDHGMLTECKDIMQFVEANCQVECAVRVLEEEGTLAFVFSSELLDPRLSNVASFPTSSVQIDLNFQKDSELTSLFDHHLLKLVQSGAVRRIYDKWLGNLRDLHRNNEDTGFVSAVPMSQFYFPLVVMALGMVASSVVASVEKIWLLTRKEKVQWT